jgi:tetratricopeptide (TPR) repeat protein
VALFVARAQAADRGFALGAGNAGAVAALCRGLDGMPLAIELAASRVALLGVEGLRARLDERLRVLTVATRGALPRHRTLQAALEWSHELLHPDERAVLRRLAVFVDGFTLEAAQQVAADEALDGWDVLEYLGALVDRSLVQAEMQAEGEPLPRYRLLETTRQFALEQLAHSGEEAAVRDRHQAWVLALAEETERHFAGADTALWVARLAREQANLLAALAWSHGEASAERELRLVALLRHFGGAFGIVAVCHAASVAVLARPACQAPTRWRARALTATAKQAFEMGRLADARALDEEALAVARPCADLEAAARALIGLSFVATTQGDLATARERLEEAEAAARDAGHERLLASVLAGQAIAMQRAGDLDGAAARYAENLRLWQRLGHGYNQAVGAMNLASVHQAAGRSGQARALLAEAIAQARRIGAPRQLVAAIAAAAAQGADGHAAPTSVIRLHAALAALRTAAGFDAALEADEQQALDRARAAVGHEARLQAERAGRGMDWAQVLDEASAVVAVAPPASPAAASAAGSPAAAT